MAWVSATCVRKRSSQDYEMDLVCYGRGYSPALGTKWPDSVMVCCPMVTVKSLVESFLRTSKAASSALLDGMASFNMDVCPNS